MDLRFFFTFKYIFWGLIGIGLILLVTVVSQYVHAAATTVVTPTNLNGWGFFQETPTGSGTFVPGPSTPPLGGSSAQITVNDTGGEIFGTFAFVGTRLDAITSLGYSTYRSSGGSALAPSLQFDIDTDVTDANTAWQGRLVYEPYFTHAVSTGLWQTWNPLDNAGTGNWWFSGAPGNAVCPMSSPCTWAKILVSFPNAGIRSAGANTGALQFKAGGGWTGGFVGNVDAFSIGVNNIVTTYDFELPTARLTLVKTVINSNGGTSTPQNFQLLIFDPVANSFSQVSSGQQRTLNPGSYTASEIGDPAHYDASLWGGDCNGNGTITLVADQIATCTITNHDKAPVVVASALASLHIIKQVVNGNGGTAVPSNFSLHVRNAGTDVSGSPAAGTSTPGTLYSLSAGTYVVGEDATTSYVQSFSGDCNATSTIALTSGDNKICTITNTDIPPPPAAPTPAPVTPQVVSGGGGGNGPIVGSFGTIVTVVPIIVPLIGILKIPTPLALPGGSGTVTYNYTVWNVGGRQALTDVTVTDDKCAPVILLSGDTNGNGKLDPDENWKYSCVTTLLKTTTNTSIATGHGDDPSHRTAIATAIAIVVVGVPILVPGLPNTGPALIPALPDVGRLPGSRILLPMPLTKVATMATKTPPLFDVNIQAVSRQKTFPLMFAAVQAVIAAGIIALLFEHRNILLWLRHWFIGDVDPNNI